MGKLTVITGVLVVILCSVAQAHRPIFSDRVATDPNTAVLISQPAISQVIYREITNDAEQVWLAFDANEGFELFIQIGVPVLDRLKEFRPAMLVVGPGLSEEDIPFELPQGVGAKCFPTHSVKKPRFFKEHFTGTDSWILRSDTVKIPKSGRYYVVAHVPSGEKGKLWLSVGKKESFGLAEWAQFGEWKKKIRKFHEITETGGGLRIPILSDIGDILKSVGRAGGEAKKVDPNESAAATPVNPNASPEARALLNFLYTMYGKKTLSGQMWVPWGIDEIMKVQEITGKLPAIRGQDYIHERSNKREDQLAIEWWKAGGIPTIMWHWGAPSKGEGYNQSKMTIDIDRCFEKGTAEHTAMWKDLERIADHLTVLRDAHVPVLWRPMHECDGNWFWYGKGGGERFVKLWRTMFDYFVHERKLNNLIWVLCHSHRIKADWNPGKDYYDLAGPDSYGQGIQSSLFTTVKSIYGDSIPIPYHECGTIPDPDECFEKGTTWSWWMVWHTKHLTNHDRDALIRAYNHELVLIRDELPNIMDFGKKAAE